MTSVISVRRYARTRSLERLCGELSEVEVAACRGLVCSGTMLKIAKLFQIKN